MNHYNILLVIILIFCNEVYGFQSIVNSRIVQRSHTVSMSIDNFNSFLTAVVETSKKVPDDYVYGQVNAPPFVLPLAAVAIIAFAAVPFLLTSGEKALEQQREDEESTNSQFGRNRKKDV
jgi:hypothetical protein